MPFDTTITGWMTEYELGFIEGWAKSAPPNGTIVEVGSFMGRSSAAWAMSSDPSVKIYCADIFYENFIQTHNCPDEPNAPISGQLYNLWEEFKKNTKTFNSIIPIKGEVPKETAYTGGPIDILFVDATHTNPSDWDIIKYFVKFVKNGGLIIGHDYSEDYPDVIANAARLSEIYKSPLKTFEWTMFWAVDVTKPYSAEDFI